MCLGLESETLSLRGCIWAAWHFGRVVSLWNFWCGGTRVKISRVNQILTTTDAPCSCDCWSYGREIRRVKSVKVFKYTGVFLEASSKDRAHYCAPIAGLQAGIVLNLLVINGWDQAAVVLISRWIDVSKISGCRSIFLGTGILNRRCLGFLSIYK